MKQKNAITQKQLFKFTCICFGLLIMTFGCQKDDTPILEDEPLIESMKTFHLSKQEIPSHILGYVEQKTNNTFRVSIGKKGMKLSSSGTNELSRETPLGIVLTSKVVQVYNVDNTKFTFKVYEPTNVNSVINLIVVDMGDQIVEYFIQYLFDDKEAHPKLESGVVDMSVFTGTMIVYNDLGEQIGNFDFTGGDNTDANGSIDPCDEIDWDFGNDNDDETTTGGGGPPDSDDSGVDNTSSGGSSGSESGNNNSIDQADCGIVWSYGPCGCGNEDNPGNGHADSGRQCCNGGSTLVVTNTCTGQSWSSKVGNSTAKEGEDPCFGDAGVLIDGEDDDDCDTSKEDLKKVFANISDTDASTLASVINDKGKDFGIDSKEKLHHFLSQAGHEVGGFDDGFGVEESTNYSTKARLLEIFGKYYSETDTINKRKPDTYVSNSSGHANYVYCCRMGNGNEASGDGYKYRGRGIFQLTGKTNYTNFKTWYNEKYDPDKDFVSTPELLKNNDTIAILSALWYYKTSVLDKITIDSTTTVKKVTKKVNGGTNGLSDRKEIFTKAKDSIDCN